MPFGLGLSETILIFVVILLFFGPKRLPEMGAALGKGIRDFKRAISGIELDEQAPETRSAALAPQPPAAQVASGAPMQAPATQPQVAAPVAAAPGTEAPPAVAEAGEPQR
jgi:sec-independent protein translocase protein TatA